MSVRTRRYSRLISVRYRLPIGVAADGVDGVGGADSCSVFLWCVIEPPELYVVPLTLM